MSRYYPNQKHSHIALVLYPLLKVLDIFSLYVAAELFVTPATSIPVVYPLISSPPHSTGHAPLGVLRIVSWYVVCTVGSSVRLL